MWKTALLCLIISVLQVANSQQNMREYKLDIFAECYRKDIVSSEEFGETYRV